MLFNKITDLQNWPKPKSYWWWLTLPFYAFVIYYIACRFGFTADYANLIQEAYDIIHGNFFLNDWQLTGLSFISTNLPFYSLATLITGLGHNAYVLGNTMMLTAVMMSALWLVEPGRRHPLEMVFFLLLTLVPTYFSYNMLQGHGGSIFLTFLAFYAANRWLNERKKSFLVIVLAALSLAVNGDSLSITIGALPLITYTAWHLLLKEPQEDKKALLYLIITTVLAVFIGLGLDALYFAIGTASKNGILGNKKFEGLNDISGKFSEYLQGVVAITGADFFKQKLLLPATISLFTSSVLTILGFGALTGTLGKTFKGKKVDFISSLLAISICLNTFIFIFTTIAVDKYGLRYLGFIWLAFIIVLVRRREAIINFFPIKPLACGIIFFIFAAVFFGFRIYDLTKLQPGTVAAYGQLANFLEEHNLKRGYSDFWHAGSTTVMSQGKVEVRQINQNSKRKTLQPRKWFCKNSWYKEEANFVVIKNGDKIKKETVFKFFGEPHETLTFQNWQIFVYEDNLAVKLTK